MTFAPPTVHGPLARPLVELKPFYDVVVVGSGYGGAVVAARLAERGRSVCVLERGREFRPGDYPDTLFRALGEIQVQYHGRRHRSPTALFDFHVDPGMNVLVGCGLGGTSLINANVAKEPDRSVFLDGTAWPEALVADARPGGVLDRCFARAGGTLRVTAGGDRAAESLRKYQSLKRFAEAIGSAPTPENVAVNFAPIPPSVATEDGVMRSHCVRCGDCVSGCNYAAKETLIMNYLPRARQAGADIFTEARVVAVEPCQHPRACARGMRWTVRLEFVGAGRDWFTTQPLSVSARTVVLAAGALGSTEILFRSESRERELLFSGRLGARFSGNGDVLAFAYNSRDEVNGIGLGNRSAHGLDPAGTCISGSIRLKDPPVLIQDGVIPGALAPILQVGFLLAREAGGDNGAAAKRRRIASPWRFVEDCLRGGARATQTLLAMVDDRTEGLLQPGRDGVRIEWPDVMRDEAYGDVRDLYLKVKAVLQRGAGGRGLDGTYVASPFGVMTVHPLGGCAMGKNVDIGVVDDTGLVFRRDGGYHGGLYVCDASIIPRRLGVNPLLTITALAERAAPKMLDAAGQCV